MIFVAYRNNSLFEKYLPALLDGLPITSQFVIPAGTKLEDRKDEYVNTVDQAIESGARVLLTDNTCKNGYYELTNHWPSFRHTVVLDRLFADQVEGWNRGNTVAQNLCWFGQQVANGRQVRKLVVVVDHIWDHGFAGADHNTVPGNKEKAAKWIGQQLLVPFAEAEVVVVETLQQAIEHAGDPATMLVMDRHCGIKEVMGGGCSYYSLANWPHPAMLYILPFETCAVNLIDRGDFAYKFDIQAMKAEINKKIAQL